MMILFVCHANLNRSLQAAEVFRELADQKGLNVEIQSAGTNAFLAGFAPEILRASYGINGVTQLTDKMLEKADVTVALDEFVEQEIKMKHKVIPKRIFSLGITDIHTLRRGNFDALRVILNQKLEPLAKEISLLQRKPSSKEAL